MVALETSRLFAGLSEPDMTTLKNAVRIQSYSAGQVIFTEGDVGDGLYVVRAGSAQISAFVNDQERRTLSQNKRYWAAVTELARETGHSKDEMHEAMKRKFLETVIVNLGDEEIPVTASSAKLGKEIFSEYMEQVIAFAATEFGIVA